MSDGDNCYGEKWSRQRGKGVSVGEKSWFEAHHQERYLWASDIN